MRDGADWSIELERLCGRYLMAQDPRLWPVALAEIEDLANLDVPYFTTSPISKNICDSRGKVIVQEAFEEAGNDRVLQNLQAMSNNVLERELKHIEFSFQARSAEGAHHEAALVSKSALCDVPTNNVFVHEAEKIAAELAREALTTKGETEWIGLQYAHEISRYQYMPLGTDLYSGKGGIAIFLAALWSLTGDRTWRDLALSSVARARQEIAVGDATLDLSTGSLIYILTWLGRCFDDKSLIDDATNLVARLDDEVIDANDQFDVLFGASGLMLALLALAETGQETALAKAVRCGQHLLLGRKPVAGGAFAWPRPGYERPLTGFSHGAAGIAYALARLYAATGDSTYLAAAREGIEYERIVFDPQAGNWPDYRDRTRGDGGFMMSWCNGAPGIGLGRIGVQRLCSIAGLDQEITTALRSTFASGLSSLDTVCCGNFGRIELLMSADDQDWQGKAKQLASRVISRARNAGGFCTNIEVPRWARAPGFFQGTSGIGYQLLRLGTPTLPSVLLFETP
jgi:type 2 lantibiotic biosynthesis protein LanM